MNAEQKLNIVKGLKAGKRFLYDGVNYCHSDGNGTDQFICNAVQAAQRRGYCTVEESTDAVALIHKRLGNADPKSPNALTVDCWLAQRPSIRRVLDKAPNRRELVQAYRHRWVDALIQEFSK